MTKVQVEYEVLSARKGNEKQYSRIQRKDLILLIWFALEVSADVCYCCKNVGEQLPKSRHVSLAEGVHSLTPRRYKMLFNTYFEIRMLYLIPNVKRLGWVCKDDSVRGNRGRLLQIFSRVSKFREGDPQFAKSSPQLTDLC